MKHREMRDLKPMDTGNMDNRCQKRTLEFVAGSGVNLPGAVIIGTEDMLSVYP